MGPAKYAQLQAGLEMALRHLGELLERGKPLTDPSATRRYLTASFRDMPYEVFAVLYLDNRHRVLAFEELFRGTIDGASVHPREVVRQALKHNGAAVIFPITTPRGGGTFRCGPAADGAPQGRAGAARYPGARSFRGGGRGRGVVRETGLGLRADRKKKGGLRWPPQVRSSVRNLKESRRGVEEHPDRSGAVVGHHHIELVIAIDVGSRYPLRV